MIDRTCIIRKQFSQRNTENFCKDAIIELSKLLNICFLWPIKLFMFLTSPTKDVFSQMSRCLMCHIFLTTWLSCDSEQESVYISTICMYADKNTLNKSPGIANEVLCTCWRIWVELSFSKWDTEYFRTREKCNWPRVSYSWKILIRASSKVTYSTIFFKMRIAVI